MRAEQRPAYVHHVSTLPVAVTEGPWMLTSAWCSPVTMKGPEDSESLTRYISAEVPPYMCSEETASPSRLAHARSSPPFVMRTGRQVSQHHHPSGSSDRKGEEDRAQADRRHRATAR